MLQSIGIVNLCKGKDEGRKIRGLLSEREQQSSDL